jgi:uncharacterized protein (TIGR02246 family)
MTTSNATSARAGDDSAVRAVLDRVYDAWAANDADAFVAGYAEDATALLPGAYLRDKEAIHATMTNVFAGPLKGSRAGHEVQSVRFPGEGTAIVISKGAVILAGETGPRPGNRSLDSWVLSGRDGTWRVRAFHSTPENPGNAA